MTRNRRFGDEEGGRATAAPLTLLLPDGRTLCWAEYGDPNGSPVFYFHGLPGSRLEGGLADRAAQRAKVRIIAPDRPGFGNSDFQPGRTFSDWPADVAQLAAALRLGSFAVLGVSGGGVYAAACAHQIPERLVSVGIVCGLGPLVDTGLRSGMSLSTRILFALASGTPSLVRLFLRYPAGWLFRHCPQAVLPLLTGGAPAADRKVLARPEVRRMLLCSIAEAFCRGGRGAAHELVLHARPLGFAPDAITLPVCLWHGEEDATVPVAMGRWLAATLPHSRAVFIPGEGHFSLPVERMEEILRALTAGR